MTRKKAHATSVSRKCISSFKRAVKRSPAGAVSLYSQTIVATNYLYLSTIKEDFLLSLSQFSFACVFALNWINAYSCKCALKLPLIALPDVTDTLVVASKKKLWNFIAIFKYF